MAMTDRALVVEQINRSGAVIATHVLKSDNITIGRALDCDVIVRDPHVDAHHLYIARDPATDSLRCSDLRSTNGSWLVPQTRSGTLGRARQSVSQAWPFFSGQVFQLGKSWLRVSLSNHWVPAALPLSRWEPLGQAFNHWWLALGFAVCLILLQVWDSYLSQPDWQEIYRFLLNSLYPVMAVALYAGFWGFVGRHSRHEARILTHSSMALIALLAVTLLEFVAPYWTFNFGGEAWQSLVLTMFSAVCLGGVTYASVALATHLRPLARGALASLAPLAILLPALVGVLSQTDFSPLPNYNRSLVEPAGQWRVAQPPHSFVEAVENLYRPWENGDSQASTAE